MNTTSPATNSHFNFSAAGSEIAGLYVKERYWIDRYGAAHKLGAWQKLNAGYNESHRGYHAWGHIGDMLQKLDQLAPLAKRPDLIATAILWHDVVYTTQKPDGSHRPDADNVRESADLFRRYTRLNQHDADAVYAMIMATANHMNPTIDRVFYPGYEGDLKLFLDLDLSSLAAPWSEASQITGKIRKEFAWVPDPQFYTKRAEILREFAKNGEHMFQREETRHLWGAKAHENLLRFIAEMELKATELARSI